MLFLHAVVAVVEQAFQLAAVNRVEELAADARVLSLKAGLPVGHGGFAGRAVALGDLGRDELVKNLGGVRE